MSYFVNANSSDVALAKVGGKAYNLIHIEKSQVNVPSWFVLTTDCFEAFLGNRLPEYLHILENYQDDDRDKILDLICGIDFSSDLVQQICKEIKSHFSPDDLLAIRSSAVDEDSKAHSFAGMMESYLEIPADDTVFECIKK